MATTVAAQQRRWEAARPETQTWWLAGVRYVETLNRMRLAMGYEPLAVAPLTRVRAGLDGVGARIGGIA